jgi:hypothetical protein
MKQYETKMKQKRNKTPPLKINKPYKLPLKRIPNAKCQMEIIFKKSYKIDYLLLQFGKVFKPQIQIIIPKVQIPRELVLVIL